MRGLALALAILLAPVGAGAHPLRTGYLELQRTEPGTYRVLWSMPGSGVGEPEVQLGFPAGCAALDRPTATDAGERTVRTWSIRCAGGLGGGEITARGLTEAQADILVRVVEGDATLVTGRLAPLAPLLAVPAVPGTADLAWTYLALGVEHILLGVDHLLFVTALVLLVGGVAELLATVTAFTLAHSLTLALAVLGIVRIPGPPVEALIALSVALAVAAGLRRRSGAGGAWSRGRPWLLAFAFGLLHGLGFAGALGEVGVPSGAIPLALLFFNLGVELGQLAFVAGLLVAAFLWRSTPWPRPTWTTAIVPYAIGSLAMFWTVERIAAFWR